MRAWRGLAEDLERALGAGPLRYPGEAKEGLVPPRSAAPTRTGLAALPSRTDVHVVEGVKGSSPAVPPPSGAPPASRTFPWASPARRGGRLPAEPALGPRSCSRVHPYPWALPLREQR